MARPRRYYHIKYSPGYGRHRLIFTMKGKRMIWKIFDHYDPPENDNAFLPNNETAWDRAMRRYDRSSEKVNS
jgi:hypothetical protein